MLIEVDEVGVQELEVLRTQFPYFFAHQAVEIYGTAIYIASAMKVNATNK